MLEVGGLRVELAGSVKLVDDVSFRIGRGEILGLVGESGAGKSLTGAAILGLLDPPVRLAGGHISLQGERLDGLSPGEARRVRGGRIGAVFQDPLTSLNPMLTVGQHLTETIRHHLRLGRAAARSRAADLLADVGIVRPAERLDAYPHQLSGGMRQRVVIALAICTDPVLIVADEPTTALDVSVQARIIDLLGRLAQTHGTAILLVTHDMGVIAELADRVGVMYAGRLVEIGAVAAITAAPAHPYTAGLMGAIPSLDHADRLAMLPQIEGSMPRPGALPAGCAFHPRCPEAVAGCTAAVPQLHQAGPSQVACWRRAAA